MGSVSGRSVILLSMKNQEKRYSGRSDLKSSTKKNDQWFRSSQPNRFWLTEILPTFKCLFAAELPSTRCAECWPISEVAFLCLLVYNSSDGEDIVLLSYRHILQYLPTFHKRSFLVCTHAAGVKPRWPHSLEIDDFPIEKCHVLGG